jgi:hypothetical protein
VRSPRKVVAKADATGPSRTARRSSAAGTKVQSPAKKSSSTRARRRLIDSDSLAVGESIGGLMNAPPRVRRSFARATDLNGQELVPEGQRTPLSTMIFGGQGGEVRLKLYLTLVWLGVRTPWAVQDVPYSAWAQLFGLPQPETNGAHRIGDAVTWLEKHGFVVADRQQGRTTYLAPRRETGDEDYLPPQFGEDKKLLPGDGYFRVPRELWTMGWMSVLSGAGLTCLIILFDEGSGKDTGGLRHEGTNHDYTDLGEFPTAWLSGSQLEKRYRVSFDLWEKGLAELTEWGVVERSWAKHAPAFGGKRRRRQSRIVMTAIRRGPQPG